MLGKGLAKTLNGWSISAALIFFTALACSPATAASLADVDLEDQVTVDGKALTLNGLGLRTATAFKVKIYVIGLYLENQSSDPAAIMASGENKRIIMHFLHKVSSDQLSDGWSEGFADNTGDISGIKAEIAKFNASMRDVKTGDTIVLNFSGEKVDVLINDAPIDSIEGESFLQALLAIWLGPKPPNEPLKEGILGN